jgi:dipeptidyl aminopeptidase/acylaminoacyl peptidase
LKKIACLFTLSLACAFHALAQDGFEPSFEEVISLHGVSQPRISPDGQHLVFQKGTTDWEENRYDTELWISKHGQAPFQLTNNPKQSSTRAKWSPDGHWFAAFLTTNSNKFKAISVGAGISNWMTYYVNTDIHPFTRQYLKSTPWSDKALYEKASPMTNIIHASTPTLIQHGEFDKRVPPANAFELFQGLQDVGVETKLIIYKGFGHGINKPRERLAATWHNWQWINKHLWGEDVVIPKD